MYTYKFSCMSMCWYKLLLCNAQASLDEPTFTVVMHRTEPTRLQSLALQLAEKVNSLVECNERLMEMKQGNFSSFQRQGMYAVLVFYAIPMLSVIEGSILIVLVFYIITMLSVIEGSILIVIVSQWLLVTNCTNGSCYFMTSACCYCFLSAENILAL